MCQDGHVDKPKTVPERRAGALTRDRVVAVATEILDEQGETGLTFRALAARLQTGHGAIQWHVANKGELLGAATAAIVTSAVGEARPDAVPRQAVHDIALGVFDVMDAHPWLGRQLVGSAWEPTTLWVFELLGRQVAKMCTTPTDQFNATSALLTYIIGAGGREAANAGAPEAAGERQELLDTMSQFWGGLDPRRYEFTRSVAESLRTHSDRAVFVAGIDLVLAGINSKKTGIGTNI